MAQINFRIDDKTKEKAEALFSSLGMTMSGAITIFINQSLDFQGIPFTIQKREAAARPIEDLLQRFNDFKQGKNYHFHELIETEETTHTKPKKSCVRKTPNRMRRLHS